MQLNEVCLKANKKLSVFRSKFSPFVKLQSLVLGLGLGVDFTFAWDNNNNNNNDNKKSPHINFSKGTVLGDKDQGVGIRDKG